MKPISLKHRLRYSFLLLASLTLLPTTESQAQERKEEIRLEVTQKPLSQVFRQLEKSTDYKFMFSHDDVKGLQVTRKVQAGDIETVLKQLLEGLRVCQKAHLLFFFMHKAPTFTSRGFAIT